MLEYLTKWRIVKPARSSMNSATTTTTTTIIVDLRLEEMLRGKGPNVPSYKVTPRPLPRSALCQLRRFSPNTVFVRYPSQCLENWLTTSLMDEIESCCIISSYTM
jgi:hypothetical protein